MTMNAPFRYYLRVRFAECDPQRVVFNARYGDYVDLAVLEFLRALGQGKTMVNGPLDYQVVRQTLEWRAPARFDQVLEISVRAKHLGNTSLTLSTEFRIAGEPLLLATVETVYVLVDAKTLVKVSLPDDFRSVVEEGGRGLIVDHSNSTPRRSHNEPS